MLEGIYLNQRINVFNHIISDLKQIYVKFEDKDDVTESPIYFYL